ncbi:MAG: maltose alpha-D-glucosyltransferase [Bryobacteraceae bacterium]|nr:maltose alpha-D-glucosyltransferase [Bryobacteraceae bacterium]
MATRDDIFPVDDDPLWYKDAIIYELHVRAFRDSNGDGMGDFRGLAEKLDYLQYLGVTTIWLLPFSPSPWRDDGYDIAEYTEVHPAYGSLEDFKLFLGEAHRRGLRVLTEVVINHTSDQHPWFQRARQAEPGSRWRDFYVWSDSPDKYKEARIIFKDFETSNWTWDPVAKAWYWHRFYSHQPDLNFDNPEVRQAIKEISEFWFEMGVDAVRLDAIPYLFERENTNCENLPETHEYLKNLRAHIDRKFPGRMLLAEANQWPDDSVAYFGDGDECHMCFHFPVMPRLFMAIRMEDRYPIIEILKQTPPIPDNCQWAMFLRNHDELTLEMVTDEERDYMYRVYAQDRQARINLGIRRRLAPLLGNDRRRIELMNALLFSMPGTPVLYYGDEIGMGDNIYLGDRNGVRTPMQWNADRNAGFSDANPQRLFLPIIADPEYHPQTVNVESQQSNPSSLLWWMKRMIEQRKRFKAFSRGSIHFLHPDNRKVLAFIRKYENETLLIVANLSRFSQYVELDLNEYRGMAPVELFGQVRFPRIGDGHYTITLSAHGFYWFKLETVRSTEEMSPTPQSEKQIPVVRIDSFDKLSDDRTVNALLPLLPAYLQTRRWYGGKTRSMTSLEVADIVPFPDLGASIVIVRLEFSEGDPDFYVLPVAVARGDQADWTLERHADTVVAKLQARDGTTGVMYGAVGDPRFREALVSLIREGKAMRGRHGVIGGVPSPALLAQAATLPPHLDSTLINAEQSNTSMIFGDRLIFKIFRKVEPGPNPDIEVSRHLTEAGFTGTPAFLGHLEYQRSPDEVWQLGILQEFVSNEGDAWKYTLDSLSQFYEAALVSGDPPALNARHLLDLASEDPPQRALELIGTYLESARLLGQRSAEMHVGLAAGTGPDFEPEPFTDHYRQGLFHGFNSQASRSLEELRRSLPTLTGPVLEMAQQVLAQEERIRATFQSLRTQRLNSQRIRHHGDFHLGQVLFTGKDFSIIDFEGEPARPLSERRLRRSPLRDVAGMLRSFRYASGAALFGHVPGVVPTSDSAQKLTDWADFWNQWVGGAFLRGYLRSSRGAAFLPATVQEFRTLLDVYVMDKALYEVIYELRFRPAWVRIPLSGILQLIR